MAADHKREQEARRRRERDEEIDALRRANRERAEQNKNAETTLKIVIGVGAVLLALKFGGLI